MIHRTTLINKLINANKYTSYLEIGISDGHNFRQINIPQKTGVDPILNLPTKNLLKITSDQFFLTNATTFDIIFIDGLHEAHQVEKDIINSYQRLNLGGTILIHDIRPFDKISQAVPRQTQRWTGDVWRSWYGLKNTYNDDLKLQFIDERAGIGMIYKDTDTPIKKGFTDYTTTYEEYHQKKGWLV